MNKRRAYTPVERQRSVEAGRARIVAAARELLEADDDEGFSIDAVARQAGVARMTVYNQFESKAGLLEALFDSLALNGPLAQIPEIIKQSDALAALDEYVAIFGQFWTINRRAHRRLRAAAVHDAELAAAMANRNERRRRGITELVRRLGDRATPIVAEAELVTVLYVMLSFETFDAFAGDRRTPADVVPVVRQLVHGVLGIR